MILISEKNNLNLRIPKTIAFLSRKDLLFIDDLVMAGWRLSARNTIPCLGRCLTEASEMVYPVQDSEAKNPYPVQRNVHV